MLPNYPAYHFMPAREPNMSMPEYACEREAVDRLYQLARQGETGCGEYLRLDQLIYGGLIRTYGREDGDSRHATAA